MLIAFRNRILTYPGMPLALACAAAAVVAAGLGTVRPHPASAQWTVTAVLQTKVAASASPAPAGVTAATAQVKQTSAQPVPACTPQVFSTPAPLNLDSADDGLTTQNDPSAYYRIYGDTASELTRQIQRCAPGSDGSASAEFTARTDYRLNWQYSVVQDDAGCHLADIKVGLHTAAAMPLWQPGMSASPGLAGRWQAFYASLLTHEQGHTTLDQNYAAKLLFNLDALGTMSCGDINAAVSSLTSADTGALDQANDAYDVATDHGAAQGAVLPGY